MRSYSRFGSHIFICKHQNYVPLAMQWFRQRLSHAWSRTAFKQCIYNSCPSNLCSTHYGHRILSPYHQFLQCPMPPSCPQLAMPQKHIRWNRRAARLCAEPALRCSLHLAKRFIETLCKRSTLQHRQCVLGSDVVECSPS